MLDISDFQIICWYIKNVIKYVKENMWLLYLLIFILIFKLKIYYRYSRYIVIFIKFKYLLIHTHKNANKVIMFYELLFF